MPGGPRAIVASAIHLLLVHTASRVAGLVVLGGRLDRQVAISTTEF